MSEAVINRFEPIQIQNCNRESSTFRPPFQHHFVEPCNKSPPVREISQSVSIGNLFGLGLLCYCERLCAAGPFSFCEDLGAGGNEVQETIITRIQHRKYKCHDK